MTTQVSDIVSCAGGYGPMSIGPSVPLEHPGLVECRLPTRADPMLEEDLDFATSTACYRRYVAEWRIENGSLFLIRVRGRCMLRSPEPLFADWYSGPVLVPAGKPVFHSLIGVSVFDNEIMFAVEAGRVLSSNLVRALAGKGLAYYSQLLADRSHGTYRDDA